MSECSHGGTVDFAEFCKTPVCTGHVLLEKRFPLKLVLMFTHFQEKSGGGMGLPPIHSRRKTWWPGHRGHHFLDWSQVDTHAHFQEKSEVRMGLPPISQQKEDMAQ